MISYREYKKYLEKEILDLYESVGWSNYYLKPKMLNRAYENSLKIVAAYDNEKLIGIIRVVGDGYSIVYIQDIIVHPNYQRKRIGTHLIDKILKEYKEVYQIILLTDDSIKTKEFYQSLGFISCTDYECISFLKIKNT